MKILHVCGEMVIGGAERAIYQLVKCQLEGGNKVDILSTSQQSFYSQKVCELDSTVHSVGQKSGADFTCVRKYLKLACKYDVVHFHATNPALILASIFLGKKQRLFYTHRGGVHKFPIKRYLSHRISGFCIKHKFDGVSGNTYHAAKVASNLFRIPNAKVNVTYNGIYFELLTPKRNTKQVLNELGVRGRSKFLIGTTAKLIKWKRIDYLIQAIALMRDAPVHCFIIGDGPDRKRLKTLTSNLGVSEKISFTGRKEHVGDYLGVLDVFVLPSGSGESFGNSVVEAMSFGIPTIVMQDGGGMLEHYPEGFEMVAKDPADLARLITSIVDTPEIGREIGTICNEYVRRKYTVRNMKEGYDRLYQLI